ncbi:HNH endonuclease [Thioalkalicoccus limnaeus]|uniref:HNH endonuclease n=1 Tax=Thioalkalicoccus limnaeus TaxID=120681 RepID=A0ABV4BBT3_9GAMM
MSERDSEIRVAAFARCRHLLQAHGGAVPWEAIRAGFEGERLVLAGKARGIHRPARLHQGEFRALVLDAYDRRCAISGLPIPDLLEAAHIIPDRDVRGRPEVNNGLCLSTLHHSAYDRNLLGIDPDGRVVVAPAVLEQHDGPTLEQSIKGFNGQQIRWPRHAQDRPNPEFLAERFEQFRDATGM